MITDSYFFKRALAEFVRIKADINSQYQFN